jgi:hypothetical protein
VPTRFAAVALLVLAVIGCTPTASSPTPTVSTSPAATATPTPAPASPTPTPTAAARIQVSDAPITGSGGKLLLFQLSAETRLHAITWDASVSGVLPGEIPLNAVWSQSPYGAPYLVGTLVLDRDGRPIGPVPWPSKIRPTWSTDGSSLCAAVPEREITGAAMRLEQLTLGQPARVVASGFTTFSDNAGYPVLACDPARDRAVFGSFGQGVSASRLWMLRLSTGDVVRSVDYRGSAGTWVAASPDGALLAEAVPQGPMPTDRWTTTIRKTDDGAPVGTVDGFIAQGFSGDGTLMVGVKGKAVAVVDWKTGREVWTTTDGTYEGHLAEPAGSHFAVGVLRTDRSDVYIVSGDGSAVLLPAGVRVPMRF